MFPIFLALSLYTSPQFCTELTEELQAAVSRQEITQVQADGISNNCLMVYTEGS